MVLFIKAYSICSFLVCKISFLQNMAEAVITYFVQGFEKGSSVLCSSMLDVICKRLAIYYS